MSRSSEPLSLARYVSDTAAGGLALVQGLLNTRETASAWIDLLESLPDAKAWLTEALREWGQRTGSAVICVALDDEGLEALRELRQRVRSFVAGERANL